MWPEKPEEFSFLADNEFITFLRGLIPFWNETSG